MRFKKYSYTQCALLYIILEFFLRTSSVYACMCASPSPCSAIQKADLVFRGTYLENDCQTQLRVDEVFKGNVAPGTIVKYGAARCHDKSIEGRVVTTLTSVVSSCDAYFHRGQHIVFASRQKQASIQSTTLQVGDDLYSTSACSGNANPETAPEVLQYLRSADVDRQNHTWLKILIETHTDNRYASHSSSPGTITFDVTDSAGKKWRVKSNKKGFFSSNKFPPGMLLIQPQVPDGYVAVERDESSSLLQPTYRELPVGHQARIFLPAGTCITKTMLFKPQTQISGILVDHDGHPLAGRKIHIIPETMDENDLRHNAVSEREGKRSVLFDAMVGTITDENGNFVMKGFHPLRYYLTVNFPHLKPTASQLEYMSFYPNSFSKHQAVRLTFEKDFVQKDFKITAPLPPKLFQLSGRITARDGSPLTHAAVYVSDSNNSGTSIQRDLAKEIVSNPDRLPISFFQHIFAATVTDTRGAYSLQMVEGQQAWLHAHAPEAEGTRFGLFNSVKIPSNTSKPLVVDLTVPH